MQKKRSAVAILLLSTSLSVFSQSPWLVRVRGITVIPEASSDQINGVNGEVTDISKQIVPELDFSYFFTSHISAELILATAKHSVNATGTIIGKVDLGSAYLLPPTLTAQYHFFPDNSFNPYVGVGVNYTHFYNINPGPLANAIDYDSTVDVAWQVGTDFQLNEHWLINLDLKKAYIEPDVTIYSGLGKINSKVKIDPWIAGVGIGYRF